MERERITINGGVARGSSVSFSDAPSKNLLAGWR
jgi:hypothetical protein